MRWEGHVACTGRREMRKGFGGDSGVDVVVILKWIFGKWDGGVDWIDLAQDRDKWRALVNSVMNLRVL
jgi:hypothetical protein